MNFTKSLNLFIILSVVVWTIIISNFVIDIDFINLDKTKILFICLINFVFIILLNLINDQNLEDYLLFILVWLGSLIIITSNHLLIIYLGLELQTFSSFILISKNKLSIKGSEAGLKYFILGAISSGIYLLGSYLLFVNNLSLNVNEIIIFGGNNLFSFGFLFIILSIIFKLAIAPIHFWIPDVYEGSSWIVIGLLSTIPKISILYFFTQIFIYNSNLLLNCSLLSVIIGTIGALNQSKLKRLLAYSGITHMGFIVLGLSINNLVGNEIFIIYLIIYMLTSITLFILIMNSFTDWQDYIINLSRFKYKNKLISITWVLLLLSMAGLPPLTGFISKWFVIWNIISFNYFYSSIILVIFSIIGVIYYLRISQIIYFQKKSSYLIWESILRRDEINNSSLIFLGLGLFFTITFIINPEPLLLMINYIIFN